MNILDECWEWKGTLTPLGYGQKSIGDRHFATHRLSWAWANDRWSEKGPPKGLCVLHRCDNPACCNPRHLFLGTKKDNSQDMVRKGRNRCQRGEKVALSKLTEEKIRLIRASRKSNRQLAEEFGVCHPNISRIRSRKMWKHVL